MPKPGAFHHLAFARNPILAIGNFLEELNIRAN